MVFRNQVNIWGTSRLRGVLSGIVAISRGMTSEVLAGLKVVVMGVFATRVFSSGKLAWWVGSHLRFNRGCA
jgi:hypothetical protein